MRKIANTPLDLVVHEFPSTLTSPISVVFKVAFPPLKHHLDLKLAVMLQLLLQAPSASHLQLPGFPAFHRGVLTSLWLPLSY